MTAAWTCTSRALSYFESEQPYRSGDSVAPVLLPKFLFFLFKVKFFQNLFKYKIIPKGMYKYIIARTKYFDSVFENAVKNNFEQILIFGAGYDTRAIRLLSGNRAIKVFELDAPTTQTAKINQLKKRGVRIPPNAVFIPIDFNKESLKSRLTEAGFEKGRKSLFMLEGITMYLQKESIDSTFRVMDEFSGFGSEIVFDYIYLNVLKRENTLYGEKEIYKIVKSADEEWRYGIEKGRMGSFLKAYHFDLAEDLGPDDLEGMYFKDERSRKYGEINGTHAIAHAKKCADL